jgi:hypothetical protein
MFDDLTQVAGSTKADQMQFAQNVSRTLTEARLTGSRRIEVGEGEDETVIVDAD